MFHPLQWAAIASQDIGGIGTWTANNATLSAQDAFLVAYWKAEDVTDSVGSHTLTNNNSVTFTAGKHNDAFTLDASNESLTGASSADFDVADGDFTYSIWAKPSGLSGFQCFYNTRWDVGNRSSQLYLWTGTNDVIFSFSTNGTNTTNVTFAWAPIATTQYHLVLSRIGADLKCYIDGSQIGSTYNISTTTIYYNNYGINIGNDGNDTAPWAGQIDEFGLWKGYGADQTFVDALYNSGTGAFRV